MAMNAIRRAFIYGGGVVGSLGGAVASRTSVEGHAPALNDARLPTEDEVITIHPHSHEGARSLLIRPAASEVTFEHEQDQSSAACSYSRADVVEHLHEFDHRPIERDEIDNIVSTDQHSYYDLVPSHFRSSVHTDSRAFEFGRELVSRDPELVRMFSKSLASMLVSAETQQSITASQAEEAEEQELASSLVEDSAYVTIGASLVDGTCTEESWRALRHKYKCSICQDVLCAPHLLIGCAHSFCGGCIQEHLDLGTKDDCDVVTCPKCRHEIDQSPCYEPDFDNTILAAVEQTPPCEDKTLWMERREECVRRLRRQRRMEQGKQGASGDGNNASGSGSFWGMVQDKYLEAIIGAVAVILIIIAVKRSVGR